MHRKNALAAATEACFAVSAAKGNVMEAARVLFAGVSASKRDEIRAEWYADIVARAGLVDGKPMKARDLPVDVKRAYGAAREAYRALYGSGSGSKKKSKAKAIVIPMTAKGIKAMVKAAHGALKKAENVPFDVPRVMAAWAALEQAYLPINE